MNDPVSRLFPGQIIKVRRMLFYRHFGVYLGSDRLGRDLVWHFSGAGLNKLNATCQISSIEQFANGGRIEHESVAYPYRLYSEIQRLAYDTRGQSGYNLFQNNCEHAAYWLATGVEISVQANYLILASIFAGATALVIAEARAGI